MKETSYRKRAKKRKRRRLLFRMLLLIIALLAADYLLYPMLSPAGGRSFNKGTNASWLQDLWYFGESKEKPVILAARLTDQQIKYAYFHVRYIKKDGTLRFRKPDAARRLTATMRPLVPTTKLIAWIYIGNERGVSGVDISDPKVRRNIVKEARWLVNECGFDGVQIDYEICSDGDQNLLALLSETRRAMPKGKLLSVATPMWLPSPLGQWGWSESYFAKVAAACDQIAVMSYDSALYWPRHYVWLIRHQTIRISNAVAKGNPKCRVLMGIPTYEDGGPSHHPHAENIEMALKGIREGLADPSAAQSVFEGTALFADYTTDRSEENSYRQLWLE
jgi:hypothetical protein